MEEESIHKVTLEQSIPVSKRFIWVIKNFSEIHNRLSLESPDFFLNIDGIQQKFRFELCEYPNEDDTDDIYYKLVFHFDSEFEISKKYLIIYSILDRDGDILQDEDKEIVRVSPKSKVIERCTFVEQFDMRDLVFRNGIIVINICVVDITLNRNIIFNLVESSCSEQDLQFRIPKQFANFYELKDLSDFVIMAENREFHVHKFALATSSPVFAALFLNGTKCQQANSLLVLDASAQVVQEMIHYMYTGHVNNLNVVAKDLLMIAHKYGLDQLVKICMNHLKKNINVNNVMHMLAFAIKYNLNDLKYATHMYFIANTKNVLDGDEFNEFINAFAFSFDNLI